MSEAPPRRVLILVENLPVPLDRRVWLEATTLVGAGYEVSVICPTGKGWDAPREVIDGVHIYRYPAPPEAHSGGLAYAREWGTALWHMLRLSQVVWRERGFDVVQGCNPPDLLFLLGLRWRLSGVRYLFDHHDVCPELFEAKFGKRGPLWWAMRAFERLNFATASVVMSTNESFRKLALTRGGKAAEDVFVVRSAPRVATFRPGDGDAVADGRLRLGYVGVIGQQEGMDLLVAAADDLVRGRGRDDALFEIVGFGPGLPEMQADVARRGLEKHFTFHGALYGDDLLAVLNRCDIGVSPDPKNAMNDISTMNKIMEYMSLERPVVQFDLTEGRASAGEASLYARANDPSDFAAKIVELADDPARRARMGRIGRDRVQTRLSWEHSTPHLLAAYDRIFGKLGRKARADRPIAPAAMRDAR